MADEKDNRIVHLAARATPTDNGKASRPAGEGAKRAHGLTILPIAAVMVGVCTALVGLVKVAEIRIGPSAVDEYSACAAVLFLFSVIASYLSLRFDDRSTLRDRLGLLADTLFIAGLVAITAVTMLFAYEVI